MLFIEKEGFTEILKHAGLAERYDMAIMSTKGIPVDAACDLIARFEQEGVRTFALHDFDSAGFKIVRTLRQGTRLSVGTDVVDLGLRMADIDGLPSEPVTYKQEADPKFYLQYDCDATEEEAEYLVQGRRMGRWQGERVEINAMTSEQLIGWLESKLKAHGVKKLVPDDDTLLEAYRRALFLQRMDREIERLQEEIEAEDDDEHSPSGLSKTVAAKLKESPSLSWDEAVWRIADDDIEARDEY